MASTSSLGGLPERAEGYALRLSAYDRASALLVTLLILVGVVVAGLGIVWFSAQVAVVHPPVQVLLDVGGGTPQGLPGAGMLLQAPDPAELAQQTDLPEPSAEQMHQLVTELAATRPLELEDQLLDAAVAGGGGRATGQGDRPALGQGEGEPGLPREQRWVIEFEPGITLQAYARALDALGIELGLVGRGGGVHYLSALSQPAPQVRQGNGRDERRLHFSWRRGSLREADRQLAQRAGLDPRGGVLVQFIPPELEQRLALLEKEFAEQRSRQVFEIRQTRFGIRTAGGGYEFYILDQRYF